MVSGGTTPATPRSALTPRSPGPRPASIACQQLPLLEKRRSEPAMEPQLPTRVKQRDYKPDVKVKLAWPDAATVRSAQPSRSPPELSTSSRRRHSVFPAISFDSQREMEQGRRLQSEIDCDQEQRLGSSHHRRAKTDKPPRRSKRRRNRFSKSLSMEAKTAVMLTYDDLIVSKMSQIDLDPDSLAAKTKSYESPAQSDTEDDVTTVSIQKAMDILDCLKEKTGEHVTSTRHRERVWDPVVQLQSWRNRVHGQTPPHWTKALVQS